MRCCVETGWTCGVVWRQVRHVVCYGIYGDGLDAWCATSAQSSQQLPPPTFAFVCLFVCLFVGWLVA